MLQKLYSFFCCIKIVVSSLGREKSKTPDAIALFHEMKFAVVARLSEGAARVSKPQANESME